MGVAAGKKYKRASALLASGESGEGSNNRREPWGSYGLGSGNGDS